MIIGFKLLLLILLFNQNNSLKPNNKQILYRCCDAYVCSIKCSINRYKNIKNYDPELNSPTDWHSFNKPKFNTFYISYKNRNFDDSNNILNSNI
jgi:hypothetical protein